MPTPLMLDKIVSAMDDICEVMPKSVDARGDVYEYLLLMLKSGCIPACIIVTMKTGRM